MLADIERRRALRAQLFTVTNDPGQEAPCKRS
jgi:hypothetical protein